jgi:hypothetical protein
MHSPIYQNSDSDAWPRLKGVIIFVTLSREQAICRGRGLGIDVTEYETMSIADQPHVWTVADLAAIVPRDTDILAFNGLADLLAPADRTASCVRRLAQEIADEVAIPDLIVVPSMFPELNDTELRETELGETDSNESDVSDTQLEI